MNQKYDLIQQYVDLDNLIDYMIMIQFTGNKDAPTLIGNNNSPRNFYASRDRDNGQFRFFLWDSEHSLEATDPRDPVTNNPSATAQLW